MKIVILGGSGFIGENLAKNLIEKNFKVLILDKKPSFKFPNLFQYFDITKASDFSNLFNSEDIIINLAAVHKDNEPKSAYEKVNVKGSENLCYLAKQKKIRHIIFLVLSRFMVLRIRKLMKTEKLNLSMNMEGVKPRPRRFT